MRPKLILFSITLLFLFLILTVFNVAKVDGCVRAVDWLEQAVWIAARQSETVVVNGESKTLWTWVHFLISRESDTMGRTENKTSLGAYRYPHTTCDLYYRQWYGTFEDGFEPDAQVVNFGVMLHTFPEEYLFTQESGNTHHIRFKGVITDEWAEFEPKSIPIDLEYWIKVQDLQDTGKVNYTPGDDERWSKFPRHAMWAIGDSLQETGAGVVTGTIGDITLTDCTKKQCDPAVKLDSFGVFSWIQREPVEFPDDSWVCAPPGLSRR